MICTKKWKWKISAGGAVPALSEDDSRTFFGFHMKRRFEKQYRNVLLGLVLKYVDMTGANFSDARSHTRLFEPVNHQR
jgi:hypothetical protein